MKTPMTANGNRLRSFRDVAGITMDTAGVERVDFNARGGADLVTINDLRGAAVPSRGPWRDPHAKRMRHRRGQNDR